MRIPYNDPEAHGMRGYGVLYKVPTSVLYGSLARDLPKMYTLYGTFQTRGEIQSQN